MIAVIFSSSVIHVPRSHRIRLVSVGLQGHFSFTIEQVHALLVELEPDLLVRCDGDVGRTR